MQGTINIQDFMKHLAQNGLVIVPKTLVEQNLDHAKLKAAQNKELKKKWTTPYYIAKYQLIDGVTSIKTIKAMIKDGRIGANEHYTDEKGKCKILVTAIKRLREL